MQQFAGSCLALADIGAGAVAPDTRDLSACSSANGIAVFTLSGFLVFSGGAVKGPFAPGWLSFARSACRQVGSVVIAIMSNRILPSLWIAGFQLVAIGCACDQGDGRRGFAAGNLDSCGRPILFSASADILPVFGVTGGASGRFALIGTGALTRPDAPAFPS